MHSCLEQLRRDVRHEVEYLEGSRNQVQVHANRSVHLLREPVSAVEARLDPGRFTCIHRSVIVNLHRAVEIQPWFSGDAMLVLQGGAKLRVSRGYRRALQERLSAPSRAAASRGAPGRE